MIPRRSVHRGRCAVTFLLALALLAADRPPGTPPSLSTRRLGKAGKCDLCNKAVGPDAPCYSPTQVRAAVRAGLRPPEAFFTAGMRLGVPKNKVEAGWVRGVMADTTDWAFSPECAARMERCLLAARPRKPAPADPDPRAVAEFAALYHKGRALREKGNLAEAAALYEKALPLAERLFGDDLNTGRLLNNLALLYHRLGQHARADPLLQRSLKIIEKELGPDHPHVAAGLDNYGTVCMALHRYEKAEGLYRKALRIRETRLPPGHVDISQTLNNLANACHHARRYAEAEELYQRALRIAEKTAGLDHPDTATVVVNLAHHYQERNQYDRAAPLWERALKIRKARLGADDPSVAAILGELAVVAIHQARYADAAGLLARSRKIQEKKLGPDHPEVADGLAAEARLLEKLGEVSRAEPLARRSLKIREARLGPSDPKLLGGLRDLGQILLTLGRYPEADELLRRAVTAQEAVDPDGLEMADSLDTLGILCRLRGRYNEAETLYRRSLKIREKRLGPRHVDLGGTLNNLAVLYQTMGRYPEAESHYQRSLRISETALGADDPAVAQTINSLGTLYAQMGLFEQALPLLERGLHIKERRLGPNHPGVAVSLDNLAGLLHQMRRTDRAVALLARSLKIRKSALPRDHPSLAITLHNLAELSMHLGLYAEAAKLYCDSLEIAEAKLGPDHPVVAASLNYLAHTCMAQKQFAEAERLLKRSLAIREARLPADHPEVAISLNYLADLYAMTRRWDEAAAAADRSRHILGRHAARVLPSLPERDQLAFLKRWRDTFSTALTLPHAHATDARLAAQAAGWVLNGKGIAHEVLARRARLVRQRKDEATGQRLRELLDVRAELATLSLSPPPGPIAEHWRIISRLVARERDLSKQLGQSIEQDDRKESWVTLEEVRRAIPEDAVLIEVAQFAPANYETRRQNPARYAAWVIPPAGKGAVRRVDLGEADRIETAVRAVRQGLRDAPAAIGKRGAAAAERDLREPLSALSRLVYEPLAAHVDPAARWIISPDAALWLVPWAALPLADGRYALEKHHIQYVVSGRDLVRTPSTAAPGPPLVLADPDFDLDRADASPRSPSPLRAAPASLRDLAGVRWPRLPGTAAEARSLAPSLARYAGAEPLVRTGPEAREEAFKAARSPRVLVLCTHGFFLEDTDPGVTPLLASWEDRGVFIAPDRRPGSVRPTGRVRPVENPLLRCGLVLAGANRRAGSGPAEDGILTGLEIIGADLHGTALVVLSACETGLGEVRQGEGVAGLRQAFQLAGARTVVATLWKIPDAETAQLMTDYFDHLAKGQGKADALRHAQLALVESLRRDRGAAHPLFWAAFTLTGDPGTSRVEKEPPAADAPPPRPWLTRPAVLVPAAVALGLGAGWVVWRRRGRGVPCARPQG